MRRSDCRVRILRHPRTPGKGLHPLLPLLQDAPAEIGFARISENDIYFGVRILSRGGLGKDDQVSNWNPIRRSPIKPKSREHKESAPWRRKKVRLSGPEMAQLRQDAFARSGGRCENAIDGLRCKTRIFWTYSHLAHLQGRGVGGSDELSNVLMVCPACHEEDTRKRRRLVPHPDWIAEAA